MCSFKAESESSSPLVIIQALKKKETPYEYLIQDILLEKFIALNPLYLIDDYEEYDNNKDRKLSFESTYEKNEKNQ